MHTIYQHRKQKKQDTAYTPPPSPAVEVSGGDGVLAELDCEDAAG